MMPFNAMRFRHVAVAPPAVMAFDPSNTMTDDITLSNSNRTATNTGGDGLGASRVELSKSSGLLYLEFLIVEAGTSVAVGVVTDGFDATNAGTDYLGGNPESWAYWSEGAVYYDSIDTPTGYDTLADGDVVGIALDHVTGSVWFAKNNTWQASGNPATGTNASYINALLQGEVWPCADCYANTSSVTLRRGIDNSYSAPSGFSAWDA